ncbi:MFS transporter [Rubritalea marina]|uniref:MFS transporter n=1 Tax=Rubritalea marina TaxID=361055 RepID=UPI001969D437|nr:MFS transporter [Rubritalea marina]
MEEARTNSASNLWIGVVYFLIFIPLGLCTPALPNILESHGALWVIPFATAVGPVTAIFSSLMFTSMADRRWEAQKILGCITILGSVFVWLQFSVLQWGWSPWWYVFFQGCNVLISAPMIPLISTITLANISDPQRNFPLYNLCGTLGWLSAGVLVSWLSLDASTRVGEIAAAVRLGLGGICFLLPMTRPRGQRAKNWKEVLGFKAFTLMRDRSLKVYYISAFLFAIPLAAHYMYAPKLLSELAALSQNEVAMQSLLVRVLPGPSAQMALGQVSEIGAMLLLSWLGARAKVKPFIVTAMILALIRYGFYAGAGYSGMIYLMWIGVALHGPIFTFFTVTGKIFVNRRVSESMRGQAQALLSLMSNAAGQTSGALSCGLLFQMTGAGRVWIGWTLFWSILSLLIVLCLAYFAFGYRRKPD